MSNTKTPTKLIGYFRADSIHARNYFVPDIPAGQLTHVNYAFADVSPAGVCVSINEQDDKANVAELIKLKQQHPKLRTLISVGGAAHSANFASAASTDAGCLKLVKSCIAFMTQRGFDGIDIDWEFPAAADKANYTALIVELRRQLDALGGTDGRHYLLTIAAPAGPSHYQNLELNLIQTSVDWINLMAYDFVVAASTVTNFDAPLFRPADDPAAENVDTTVKAYLAAGVPAGKLVLGVHFVGTGWQGVHDTNHGLFQSDSGPAKGSWGLGSFDYEDLARNYLPTYTRYWHPDAHVPWLFNPAAGIFITYEDPQSLGAKTDYAVAKELGGIMIWELSADDARHSLIAAIAARFEASIPFVRS